MGLFYFAYGSNLDPTQMVSRCPNARLVGAGVLKGLQLIFAGHSSKWGGGVATVIKSPDTATYVEGLVWELSSDDLERLDRCEGYPYIYWREELTVEQPDGSKLSAIVYLKEDQTRTIPSERYLDTIQRAYELRGFNTGAIQRAQREVFNSPSG